MMRQIYIAPPSRARTRLAAILLAAAETVLMTAFFGALFIGVHVIHAAVGA